MKDIIDINKETTIEAWNTPRSKIVREIEHNTKLVGEMLVEDFDKHGNLTEACLYRLLPIISQILGKKNTLQTYDPSV